MARKQKPKRQQLASTAAIFETFGPTELSNKLFGTFKKRNTISMWKSRDHIPYSWRPSVVKVLQRAGFEPPDGFLEPKPPASFKPLGNLTELDERESAFAPE